MKSKISRIVKLRLRPRRDDDIQEILDALDDGDISEFIRDAIRQKKKDGLDVESILREIRELKTILERQAAQGSQPTAPPV